MERISNAERPYVNTKEPMAVADHYSLRFNGAASKFMRRFTTVNVYADGDDFIIRKGKDLSLRHYAGGSRIHNRAIIVKLGARYFTVKDEGVQVRLCERK